MLNLVRYDATLDVAHGQQSAPLMDVSAGRGHAIDPDTGLGVWRTPISDVFFQQTWPDTSMTAAARPQCLELTAD
jgi:hypothetical protein